MISELPPGANGTTKRRGLEGQACDHAPVGNRPVMALAPAVQRAREHIAVGHRWVVDVDLEKFFDRVNHDVLMSRLERRIADRRVLHEVLEECAPSRPMGRTLSAERHPSDLPSLAARERNAVRGVKRAVAMFVAYNFLYAFLVLMVWTQMED